MHPALVKLIAALAQSRMSAGRFAARGRLRGAFLILFTIGVFSMMIGPSLFVAVACEAGRACPSSPAGSSRTCRSCSWASACSFVFGPAGEMAISFTPGRSRFPVPRAVSPPRAAHLQTGEDCSWGWCSWP